LAQALGALPVLASTEALDGSALVQTHASTEVRQTPLERPTAGLARKDGFPSTEAWLRARRAAGGLAFDPEPKEEWNIADVQSDVESHLHRTDEGMLLNKAISATGGTSDSEEQVGIIRRWFDIQEQQGKYKYRSFDDAWPLRANGTDTSAMGTVLHFVPGTAGSVSLRTAYGKWIVMKQGKITASSPRLDLAGTDGMFFFQNHPYKEASEGNVICWKTWGGNFVGVGPDGGLIEMPAQAGTESSKFRMARLGEDRIVLQSIQGLIVADRDDASLADWKLWMTSQEPYQTHMLEAQAGKFLQTFGWHRGWVVGVIVGGFIMVVINNVIYSLSDQGPEEKKERLAGFDVARFVLEYVVIYSHLVSLLGLVDWGISQWLTAYKMPAFIFITGIFGSSVAYDSLAKMLCYTVGTTILLLVFRLIEVQIIWGSEELGQQVGKNFHLNDFAPGLWFLEVLFVWRLTVSPLFFAARRLGRSVVSVGAAFVFVWVLSFLLLGWTKHFTVWIYGQYNWQHLLFFAPFFAAGLLRTPEQWDELFRKRGVQAACALYFVAFHVLTAISGFKHWNRSTACLPSDAESCYVHLYPQAMYSGVHAGAFFYDLLMFALRVCLAISTVCLLCAASRALELLSPRAISLAAGWGSRTLFAYTLHAHLFTVLDKDGYAADITYFWADGTKFVVAIILAGIVAVAFSTRGCEHWFHWFLRPYWIKDLCEWMAAGCPMPARKSKSAEESEAAKDLLPQDGPKELAAAPGPSAAAASSEGKA